MKAKTVKILHEESREEKDWRCYVSAVASLGGFQVLRVEAMTPNYTGRGDGVISIRVGRVILYLEDRSALQSFLIAADRARELEIKAFGPELPPLRYKPPHVA